MKIKFCGAAREVTGSAHLLTLEDGFTILLDCGLYQGYEDHLEHFNEEWLFEPAQIDCLVLSHAHIDHSGRIPKLVRDGFRGVIHATHATRSLCNIMLLDSARIQERDADYHNRKAKESEEYDDKVELHQPLYETKDVAETMNLFATYGYNRWFKIHDQVEVLFKDAGHILGSASVTLRIKEKGRTVHFGFSGDIGRPARPILRDPQHMPELDYLICESTYGDREHLSSPNDINKLLEILTETCIQRQGKLIIPAFSVGRTQEIVYILDQLETDGRLPKVPVYVDSPLSVNATMIFASHPECFDQDLTEYMLIDENPFGFNGLKYIRHVDDSKALNTLEGPAVIISSSGMITAGRIKHHVFNNIDQEENTILIVGYCSPQSPCGVLRDGSEVLHLFGQYKPVKARVEVMDSFSAHADQLEILDFVQNQRDSLKKLFLVHGTLDRQEVLQSKLESLGYKGVEVPSLGQEYIV